MAIDPSSIVSTPLLNIVAKTVISKEEQELIKSNFEQANSHLIHICIINILYISVYLQTRLKIRRTVDALKGKISNNKTFLSHFPGKFYKGPPDFRINHVY